MFEIAASDLIAGTAGSVIGAGLTALGLYLFRRSRGALNEKATRQFWSLLNRKVVVVYPVYHGPKGEAIPNVARVEDLVAIEVVGRQLRSLGADVRVQEDRQELPEDSDVVLICSPRGNRQSGLVRERFSLPFDLSADSDGEIPHILELETKLKFTPPCDLDNGTIDFAMLARLTENTPKRRIFLLWGVHGAGTIGAARFVTSEQKLQQIGLESKNQDIAFLIRVPFSGVREIGEPQMQTPLREVPSAG